MKYIIVGLLITLLTGCGCFSVVSCATKDDFTDMSDIQKFQRRDTIGKTDIKLRKEAFYNCGISRKINLDDPIWAFQTGYEKILTKEQCIKKYNWFVDSCIDLEERDRQVNKVISCLNKKGYIEMDCGTKAKPTGFCN